MDTCAVRREVLRVQHVLDVVAVGTVSGIPSVIESIVSFGTRRTMLKIPVGVGNRGIPRSASIVRTAVWPS